MPARCPAASPDSAPPAGARQLLPLLAALLLSHQTLTGAAVIPAGEYEMTVGVAGQQMSSRVCYRARDVEILPALILMLEDRKLRQDCTVEILEQDERSARWRMRCQTPFMTRNTSGSINWNNTSFSGQALRSMDNIRTEFPFAASRRGPCRDQRNSAFPLRVSQLDIR
ncbi:MAG: DUF3617 family protein [Azonexus sp.]